MNTSDIHVLQRQRSLFFRKRAFSLVCVILLSLSAGLALVFIHTPQKAHAANWVEVWNDEFNGSANTGADSQWQYDLGTGYPCSGCSQWGTGEIETMTNSTSNVSQDGNGHLVIKALNNNGSWTSGRIETANSSFAAPAGGELEVTASLQQPNVSGQSALGYWPAFWMLGSAFRGVYSNWPSVGEIDMMEDINGLGREYATLHCGVATGGPCNEKNGLGSGAISCASCQTAYHTYTVIIDRSSSPEQIHWDLDGNQIFSVSASQMDATTWANAVDHSFFVILDLAMGGAFPNGVCGCTSPTSSTVSGASLNVDYVRVYTSSGVASTPTATPTATPVMNGSGYAVNAGGSATGSFAADEFSSGGSTYSTSASIDTSAVNNSAPQAVYQTERYGTFTYTFPNLKAGSPYAVRLHESENYWTSSGQRTFNVSINGQQVLSNFDIYATAGAANKAVVEQFNATAGSSGQITIQFTSVKDNAKVDGIEIQAGSSSTPTPTPTTSGSTPTPTPTSRTNGAACSVQYAVTNQWTGGFGASITITNTGSTTISGWTLTWSFANGQTITQLWNGSYTQSGSNVSVTNLSYNGTIAPGGNTNFGFDGSWSGSNLNPSSFTLNGAPCATA
jgi:hypothetical protein